MSVRVRLYAGLDYVTSLFLPILPRAGEHLEFSGDLYEIRAVTWKISDVGDLDHVELNASLVEARP